MKPPIIYFCFANDPTAHLDLLKEESANIKNALLPLESKEYIKLEREESAQIVKLETLLASYKDRFSIFHFAGHADSDIIKMEGGDAVAQSLAKFIGREQKKLQLVFLNGCSTKNQVKYYFDAGIKAVIATSVPVNDEKAKDFATAFYKALANKRTIKRAFHFAVNSLKTKYKNTPPIEIHRSLGRASLDEKTTEDLPWGLYINESAGESVLNYRLPTYRIDGLPTAVFSKIKQNADANKYILLVLDEMCKYNKDIYHQEWEIKEGEERRLDSSKLMNLVIENFPWIIGSQIRLLRNPTYLNTDKPRLEQLVSTYIVASQMIYFIILSDFWEIRQREKIQVPDSFLNQHITTRSNILSCDFLSNALSIYKVLEQTEAELFIAELEDFFLQLSDENSFLFKAKKYLEDIRQTLGTNISELIQKCEQAEQAISIILKGMAFLSGYKLLTVRDINIENPRGSEVAYDLDFGKLNALAEHELTTYKDQENRRKKNFTNCSSIILAPTEKNFDHYLNLSPFIIDKNTFVGGKLIDPFIFGFEEKNIFHYLCIKHNIYIAVKNEKGTDIISTAMTDKDFQEGRNITNNQKSTDSFFDEAFGITVDKGQKVFSILEEQFEKFKSDFT